MVKRVANLTGLGGRAFGSQMPVWAVGPGFQSDLIETTIPPRIANDFDFHLNALAYIDAAVKAEREGYAAVIINSFGDYGIDAMRAAVSIPVVGPGQAAMHTAAMLGRKFGIVTVWPPVLRNIYARNLQNYRLEDRCVGVWFVTEDSEMEGLVSPGGKLQEMKAGRGDLIDRIEAKAKLAIAAGADVIVQGCTCMSPVREEMAKRLPKPVLDPLAIAQKTAETWVSLGIRHPDAIAPAGSIGTLDAMLHGQGGPLPVAPAVGECEGECEVLSTRVA